MMKWLYFLHFWDFFIVKAARKMLMKLTPDLWKLDLRKSFITKFLATDNYKFVSFGSLNDTSVRIYDKTSILDWHLIPGWTESAQMLSSAMGSSGVNFTKVLLEAFMRKDPKSTKRHWWLDFLFALFGSSCIKTGCKHVGEINHRCQFH